MTEREMAREKAENIRDLLNNIEFFEGEIKTLLNMKGHDNDVYLYCAYTADSVNISPSEVEDILNSREKELEKLNCELDSYFATPKDDQQEYLFNAVKKKLEVIYTTYSGQHDAFANGCLSTICEIDNVLEGREEAKNDTE